MKASMRIEWCSYEAAKFAVEQWHYSRQMPSGKMVKFGVWEDGKFVGAILFAQGGTPRIGSPFGLQMNRCCELVRVALRKHRTPVSRMIAICIRMLKAHCPGLRIVVSYADPVEGHHGGIYKAGGWIYLGETKPNVEYLLNGKRLHKRSFTGVNFGRERLPLPPGAERRKTPPKHKYVFPLDEEMRSLLSTMSKPYPARAVVDGSPAPPVNGRSTRPARSTAA